MAFIGPNNFIGGFMDYLGFGIERAVLGRSSKFRQHRQERMVRPAAVLLSCSRGQLLYLAQTVPHLNTVISRGAEMFANMEVIPVDKDGNPAPNSQAGKAAKFLKKPNPMKKSTSSFMYEYYINNAVYSSNLLYFNKASRVSELPSAIWLLPPGEVEILVTGKMYDQVEIGGIIEGFLLRRYNKTFTPEEVVYIWEGVSANGISPTSKIEALQIPLSNIYEALKSFNVITSEKGLIGIVSQETENEDSGGQLPPKTGETKRIETDWKDRYSNDGTQGHVHFTSTPTKWIPMTFDVGQLRLHEGEEANFCCVCGAFGIDRDVFPSGKGATYENKAQGEKTTYNSTMQPLADKLMEELDNAFKFTDGSRLTASYSHLPVMQEDELKCQQAQKVKAETNAILLFNGVIDRPAFAESMEVEFSGQEKDTTADQLGKIPLALQQVALARERAITAGDTALANDLGKLMDELTAQMATLASS